MTREDFDIAKLIHIGNKAKTQIGKEYYGIDDINYIFEDGSDWYLNRGIYVKDSGNHAYPFTLMDDQNDTYTYCYLYPVEEEPINPVKQYWVYNPLTQKEEPIFDKLLSFGRSEKAEVGKEYYFGNTEEEIYHNIVDDLEYSKLKNIHHFCEYPFYFKEDYYKLCYPRFMTNFVEKNLLLNWSIFDLKDYCLKHPGKLFRYQRLEEHTYYSTISDIDVTFKQVFIAGEWEDWDAIKDKLFNADGSIIHSSND